MKTKVVLLCLSLSLLSVAEAKAGNANIVLPNYDAIGTRLAEAKKLACIPDHKKCIFPMEIRLDLKKGKIIGIIANYSNKLSFKDMENAINKSQKRWLRSSDPGDSISLSIWRNEEKWIAIQLSKNHTDNGGPCLIVTGIGLHSKHENKELNRFWESKSRRPDRDPAR